MSDRLLGLPDRLPSRARRWLMTVLPLALLGALVAGFALAPHPAGTHSEPAALDRAAAAVPDNRHRRSRPTRAAAPDRPEPRGRAGERCSARARAVARGPSPAGPGPGQRAAAGAGARQRRGDDAGGRAPVRGRVHALSGRPAAPAGRAPRSSGRARPGSRATCSPSRRGRPRCRRRTRRRSRPTGSLASSRPGRRTRWRSATSQSRTAPTPASSLLRLVREHGRWLVASLEA